MIVVAMVIPPYCVSNKVQNGITKKTIHHFLKQIARAVKHMRRTVFETNT